MKKLYAVETVDGILIEAKRTKRGANSAAARAKRRGVKNKIVKYVEAVKQ